MPSPIDVNATLPNRIRIIGNDIANATNNPAEP